jgi:hypothetical protein
MKYIIKNFIDEIYFFEKKSTRKYRIVFPKNPGGGEFYLGPPFEIFSRGGLHPTCTPPCETLLITVIEYKNF